jgi:hypothetical protein
MDRDTFRTLAAGKYAMNNLEGTIDKAHMLSFVEGAIYAYDFLNKEMKNSEEKIKKLELYNEGNKPAPRVW